MPPRYVINSLTRQTIDTTVKFDPSISSPCATVETADNFANLAAVPGSPLYDTASKTLEATIANTALVVGGVILGLGERFFLVFSGTNQERGGVYALTKLASVGNKWKAVRAADFNSDQAIVLGSHIYGITQGNSAGQIIALENKTQIVLDTTPIEITTVGAQPLNQAVGTSFITQTTQQFLAAGTNQIYGLPQLFAGGRRRVEVNIYGADLGGLNLFLQQDNLTAYNKSGGSSIGLAATVSPTFGNVGLFLVPLTVSYQAGMAGSDAIEISTGMGFAIDLTATVQITVWDT